MPTLQGSAIPVSSIEEISEPKGPPVVTIDVQGSSRNSEPMPPSIDDLDLRAPAPPDDMMAPQPPAAPDPFLLEAFEKDPASFPAVFSQWQAENNKKNNDNNKEVDAIVVGTTSDEGNRDKRRAPQRKLPTYDQFLTVAVVTGLDLQRSFFTMFPPSDLYLQEINVSLPIMALHDKDCVSNIVRAHTVPGRIALNEGTEEMALSLMGQPIFFNDKQVNGIDVVRPGIEADYGVVHIIGGVMDGAQLMDACRSQRPRLWPSSDRQARPESANELVRRISSRRVSDDEFPLDDASIRSNDINAELEAAVPAAIIPPLDEDNIPIELLVNIDNFAHAVKLTWETEDNVIAVLQGLGASTFLALLERSHLMDTINAQGPWTIFAPDNRAWQSLPKDAFDHIMHDPVLLDQILSYHIVPGNVTRRDMIHGQKLATLHDANPVHINFYTDYWSSWFTASGSQITNLDEVASNGIVHVVSSVLLPPLGDLYSTVKWTPALQTAFAMLQSANDPLFSNGSASLTAFLPEDSPVLKAITDGLSPSSLASMIRKHVVRGVWFLSGLIDGDRMMTIDDDFLAVTYDGECVAVNGACIVVRDITLTNGVLHVIDKPV